MSSRLFGTGKRRLDRARGYFAGGVSNLQSGHRPPSVDLMSSGLMPSMAFVIGSGMLRIIAGMSFITSGNFGMPLIAGTAAGAAGAGDSRAGSSALSGLAANAQRVPTT